MRIAILGTRGIPNAYGGFEQVAQQLSLGLVQLGHDVTVYNPASHPCKAMVWNGVKIVRCYSPRSSGAAGQFLYDLACTMHARKQKFDVWLLLGYTSSSVWGWLYPKKTTALISNMDGAEWKRAKYPRAVRSFLRVAEKLAVKHSHFLVADSLAVRDYLDKKYGVFSKFISYGAEIHQAEAEAGLKAFNLQKNNYYLAIARVEPENNLEMIIRGCLKAGTTRKLVIVGNLNTAHAQTLLRKYGEEPQILFVPAIYDQQQLSTLKQFCKLYFHGHSCGGTNPSLLEAMAAGAFVCAHHNLFNRAVLGDDAWYFSDAETVAALMQRADNDNMEVRRMTENNLQKIVDDYNWPVIVKKYESFMLDCLNAIR